MKTPTLYIKRCLLMAALLTASAFSVQAADTFKARVRATAQQTMNISLSASDTIPLNNLGTIYALSIDAIITQPREASFVRIVLEDVEGHNYLVAESDRFRNDTTTVNLSEYCEETAQLNGITPLRLKCYLTHASLQLTGIHISNEIPTRGMATEQELRSMKEAQVQSVVDRINEYNVRHGKLWRAGINSRALFKKEYYLIDEEDSYLANIKYYIDGIYEFGEPVAEKSVSTSNYPSSYDWRYIHGGQKQYITPIKNQDSTNWCATYAALGMLEAHINLKYNDTINLDLSEPSVAYYLQPNYWLGANETKVLNYIKNHGAIDEQSLPYQTYVNHNMPEIRPEGNENVKISNYLSMPYSWRSNPESLKDSLIKRGPCMSGFYWPNAFKSHEMLLVGYGVVTPDSFYIVNNTCIFNYVSENDSVNIGKTFWIFKDSYAGVLDWGHQGYMYLIMHNYSYMRTPYFIDSQLIWRGHTDADIVCEDIDGDGYFNWGIGPKPSHCPSWAAAQPDGDDSDDTKGPMDQYGFCSSLSLGSGVLQITNPLTIGSDYYMRNSIRVSGNGKLIIPHELHCYRGVTLTLESGTTLEIDGGLLKNIILDAKPGSSVIIKNGGRLLGNKQHGEINIPLGVNLNISEGEMRIND